MRADKFKEGHRGVQEPDGIPQCAAPAGLFGRSGGGTRLGLSPKFAHTQPEPRLAHAALEGETIQRVPKLANLSASSACATSPPSPASTCVRCRRRGCHTYLYTFRRTSSPSPRGANFAGCPSRALVACFPILPFSLTSLFTPHSSFTPSTDDTSFLPVPLDLRSGNINDPRYKLKYLPVDCNE